MQGLYKLIWESFVTHVPFYNNLVPFFPHISDTVTILNLATTLNLVAILDLVAILSLVTTNLRKTRIK